MHFPVIIHDLSVAINSNTSIPWICTRRQEVRFHYAKSTPDLFLGADGLEGGDFGAVERAEYGRVHAHCEAVDGVFREED